MFIATGQSNYSLYSQAPKAIAGVQAVAQLNQQITTNRIDADVSQLNSQTARPINYSPSIKDDRATQVPNADDSIADGSNLVQAKSSGQSQQADLQIQQVIQQLKARDTEVRAHEMAHLAVAGQYAQGMSFTYQTGPDGRQYAIGGEVGIDSAPVAGDPQATIEKARVIQRAALAPAEPSNQDQRVAQAASQMMAQAQTELMLAEKEEMTTVAADDPESTGSIEQAENSSAVTEKIAVSESADNWNGAIQERQQFAVRLQIAAG